MTNIRNFGLELRRHAPGDGNCLFAIYSVKWCKDLSTHNRYVFYHSSTGREIVQQFLFWLAIDEGFRCPQASKYRTNIAYKELDMLYDVVRVLLLKSFSLYIVLNLHVNIIVCFHGCKRYQLAFMLCD